MIRSLTALSLSLSACALPWSGVSHGAALVPPPGYRTAIGSGDDHHDCPQDATPYVGVLDFPSKYEGSDSARDDLNKRAEAEYKRRIAPIRSLEKGLAKQVDDYVDGGQEYALSCALGLLSDWAEAGALEGAAQTHTGKSMRKWALGSLAGAYLRLKFSASQPLDAHPEKAAAIEAWFARLADRVVDEWSDQPLEKVNNHEYWAAWSVMASAVVLDRRDLFGWAVKQYRTAALQIDAEGYLPNELRRKTRALHYHNYSLPPLTMIAAFAKANGEDLASLNDRALERLARRVLAGIDDPEDFEDKTGEEQLREELDEKSKFAWLEPYCWTLGCTGEFESLLGELRPLSASRLGGSVTDVFSVPLNARNEVASWKLQTKR